jgi:hypothetical protein
MKKYETKEDAKGQKDLMEERARDEKMTYYANEIHARMREEFGKDYLECYNPLNISMLIGEIEDAVVNLKPGHCLDKKQVTYSGCTVFGPNCRDTKNDYKKKMPFGRLGFKWQKDIECHITICLAGAVNTPHFMCPPFEFETSTHKWTAQINAHYSRRERIWGGSHPLGGELRLAEALTAVPKSSSEIDLPPQKNPEAEIQPDPPAYDSV